jgi:ketosteroid isomerase-like protein
MSDVSATLARFCDAWNRHDVDALTETWSEDGELNHPWGFRAVGREAIRRLLAGEHATSMAGSHLRISNISSQPGQGTVTAEVEGVLEGVQAPNGRAYDLPHKMHALFVFDGAEWRIRTLTPTANPR